MHSHNFQDTELKLCRWVEDDPGRVVEGLKLWVLLRGGGGVGWDRLWRAKNCVSASARDGGRAGAGETGGGKRGRGLGCCKGPGNAGQPS